MLPQQQRCDCRDPNPRDRAQVEQHHQPHQQTQHDQVHRARDPECRPQSQSCRNAEQSGRPVMRLILAGVEHIEPRNPEQHRNREHNDARIERAANRDPRSRRRKTQREAQKEVRPARKPLRVRVEKQHCQHHRRQQQRQPIQSPRSQEENRRHHRGKPRGKTASEQTRRDSPHARARIRGVQIGVCPAVERHCSRTRADHAHDDPRQLRGGRPAMSSQHRSGQRKRERKNRVLPLDHFQRDANAAEKRHKEKWISSYPMRSISV